MYVDSSDAIFVVVGADLCSDDVRENPSKWGKKGGEKRSKHIAKAERGLSKICLAIFSPGGHSGRQMLFESALCLTSAQTYYGHGPFEPKWTFQGHFSAHKPRSVGRVAGHNRR